MTGTTGALEMACRLTKSKVMAALQCPKRLWIAEHQPSWLPPPSQAQQLLMQQGHEVGRAARLAFGQGLLVQGHGEYSLQQTEQAIARGEQLLFEAAFCFDQVLVRCDILHQLPSRAWEIVEVKSATGVRQHHIADLAVQWHVAAGQGLDLTCARLMHLSRLGQPGALFTIRDMTAAVQSLLPEVPEWFLAIRAGLARPTAPDVPIGPHCDRPHPCPARAHCWRDVPTLSIFSIPGLNSEIKQELARQQRYGLEHVEAHHALSKPQRQQVDRWRRGEPQIDTAAIHRRLASLAHPIYFLDFETIAFALPRFPGTRPYDQIPFQYSCHVLRATGQLVHHEFLHGLASDPRPALAAALVEAIGPEGSVVAFNASFERSVLQALATALPAYAPALRSIAERLWDQLDIFRLHYFEPRFGGSNSIKNVLPVLVPELDYADLAIHHGDDAQATWLAMLETADPVQRQQHAADLRAYCQRDTLAMVAIHQALLRLAPAADPPS
jgi:hypothetical protein